MCELKAKEKKEFTAEIVYIAKVGSFNTSDSHLLPLTNFLNFNFSFLILPNIISNGIPIPFL